MRRTFLALVAAVSVGFGGYALAQDDPFEPGPGEEFRPRRGPPPGEGFGGGPGFPGGPGGTEAMSERVLEREAELLEMVKKEAPERYEKLVWLKQEHPELYPMALRKVARYADLKQRDPAAAERMKRMHELRRELHDLGETYGELSKNEQDERRAEMEQIAEEVFDLHQQDLRARLADAEKKLEQSRQKLQDREKRKGEIIDSHIERLIAGPEEPL